MHLYACKSPCFWVLVQNYKSNNVRDSQEEKSLCYLQLLSMFLPLTYRQGRPGLRMVWLSLISTASSGHMKMLRTMAVTLSKIKRQCCVPAVISDTMEVVNCQQITELATDL